MGEDARRSIELHVVEVTAEVLREARLQRHQSALPPHRLTLFLPRALWPCIETVFWSICADVQTHSPLHYRPQVSDLGLEYVLQCTTYMHHTVLAVMEDHSLLYPPLDLKSINL